MSNEKHDALTTAIRQRENELKWERNLQIDSHLREGVTAGMSFEAFQAMSQCPAHLKQRYGELQAQAKREEAREQKNNLLLKGFLE